MDFHKEVIAAVRKVGTSIANLGSSENGPSDQTIEKSEAAIGHCVPSDYLSFLKDFGSGEFFGDELFSFYENQNENVPSGDLVYQYKWHRNKNLIVSNQIPFLSTDFGEIFVFEDTLSFPKRMPLAKVLRITGGTRNSYAESFIKFIYKYSETNRR